MSGGGVGGASTCRTRRSSPRVLSSRVHTIAGAGTRVGSVRGRWHTQTTGESALHGHDETVAIESLADSSQLPTDDDSVKQHSSESSLFALAVEQQTRAASSEEALPSWCPQRLSESSSSCFFAEQQQEPFCCDLAEHSHLPSLHPCACDISILPSGRMLVVSNRAICRKASGLMYNRSVNGEGQQRPADTKHSGQAMQFANPGL